MSAKLTFQHHPIVGLRTSLGFQFYKLCVLQEDVSATLKSRQCQLVKSLHFFKIMF